SAPIQPLLLTPGWYALVFGSGDLGGTGGAGAPQNNPLATSNPSFFFWNHDNPGYFDMPISIPGKGPRYFITGTVVPEPVSTPPAAAFSAPPPPRPPPGRGTRRRPPPPPPPPPLAPSPPPHPPLPPLPHPLHRRPLAGPSLKLSYRLANEHLHPADRL